MGRPKRYSEEELERHLEEVSEEMDEPLWSVWGGKKVRELFKGEDHPAVQTYIKRWGREKTARKIIEHGIAYSQEERLKKWADTLKEHPGLKRPGDLYHILEGFNPRDINRLIEYVNENVDGLDIRENSSGGNSKRYYIKTDRSERFKKYYEMIPEEYDKWLTFGMDKGRSPRTTVAAITYLISHDITQEEVADSLGVSPVSLRNVARVLKEHGWPGDPPER